MAEKLDRILDKYVADGEDTVNRVLGAAFVVCNKDGTNQTYPPRRQLDGKSNNIVQGSSIKGLLGGPALSPLHPSSASTLGLG